MQTIKQNSIPPMNTLHMQGVLFFSNYHIPV